MASGLFSSMPDLFGSPASTLLFQLCTGSAVIGLSTPQSWLRSLALPVASACVYRIVQSATSYMRPRYASIFGGTSFCFFLQFLDVALISRWSFETHGYSPGRLASSQNKQSTTDKADIKADIKADSDLAKPASIWERSLWGWSTLWSFRHVDTPYEARNTPPFSEKDPSYVPSRAVFVAQRTAIAGACYLGLDILAARPPPPNSAALFDPALIPFFRRLGQVTLAQVKLRALSILGFAVTFYCIIQGFHSALAAVTVALGLSEPRSWRPPFGSLSKAYSLKNLWGKVWHQNLRRQITSPSFCITRKLLKLPPSSVTTQYVTVLLSFAISGLMHSVAGIASGATIKGFGVFQFFCTQAFGLILEDTVGTLYDHATQRTQAKDKMTRREPSWPLRCLGYAWVAAFLTWSGPVWLYPQAARAPSVQSNGPSGFVPYSIIGALRARL